MSRTFREKINRYIHELVYAGVDNDISKDFGLYLVDLAELSEKIDKYYKKDADGEYPTLDNDDVRELQTLYDKAIDKGMRIIKKARNDSHKDVLNYVIGKVNETLRSEATELSDIIVTDETNIQSVMEKSGSLRVDITGQNTSVESGSQSARIPLNVKDEDGNEMSGYFTESTLLDRQADFMGLVEKYAGGNIRYREALLELLGNQEVMSKYTGYSDMVNGHKEAVNKLLDPEREIGLNYLFENELQKISSADEDYTDLNTDEEFNKRLLGFFKGVQSANLKNNILNNTAGVKSGSLLEDRNAAMSAMADLLGAPDLVARSVKMVLKNGNDTKYGIFMEKAKGYDCKKVTDSYDQPLAGLLGNLNERMSRNVKRQLSDLQVLDFICGNVDRHLGNMMYTPSDEVHDGERSLEAIQGIDNDCSFGEIGVISQWHGKGRMRGLNQLKRMSKSMAKHVKFLTPEIIRTTLRPFNLSKEDIDACIDRVESLKDEINRESKFSPEFKIIDDDKWDEVQVEQDKEDTYLSDVAFKLSRAIDRTMKMYDATVFRKKKLAEIEGKNPEEEGVAEGYALNSEEQKLANVEDYKVINVIRLENRLKNVKRTFLGSPEFKLVQDLYFDIAKGDKRPTNRQTPKQMRKLKEKYETLLGLTKTYLAKKEKEEKEKLLKGKIPSKLFKDRSEFAQDLKNFTEDMIFLLDEKLKARGPIMEAAVQKLSSDINTSRELLARMNEEPADEDKRALKDDINLSIITNKTIKESIEKSGDNISEKQLDDMLSPTKREGMIEKTGEFIENADSKNVKEQSAPELPEKSARKMTIEREDLTRNSGRI